MALAPMADVTDVAFRRVIAKYGKPDVMWTEFVSADGLYATREKLQKPDSDNPLMQDLLFDVSERPIVAQLFSSNPERMEYGARLVQELGFDGVDINMGCPDRSIEKQGCGAAHIKNPERAREIIRAAKKGAPNLPVSVKTRIGYNTEGIDSWIGELLKENLSALIVHLRTRKEMSKVPAHWEFVPQLLTLRDAIAPDTLMLANGDVKTLAGAEEKVAEYGIDGVMLGRAIFGNPWRFSREVQKEEMSPEERLKVLLEHTKLFEELLPHKNFHIMKKHFKSYTEGLPGAQELRNKLMETQNAREVEEVLGAYIDAV